MKDLLLPLHEENDTLGGAILTPDGVLVASTLEGVDVEAVVALVSQLVHQMGSGLREAGQEKFQKITLDAVYGKLLVLNLGDAFLVVAAGPASDLPQLWGRVNEIAGNFPRLTEASGKE